MSGEERREKFPEAERWKWFGNINSSTKKKSCEKEKINICVWDLLSYVHGFSNVTEEVNWHFLGRRSHLRKRWDEEKSSKRPHGDLKWWQRN